MMRRRGVRAPCRCCCGWLLAGSMCHRMLGSLRNSSSSRLVTESRYTCSRSRVILTSCRPDLAMNARLPVLPGHRVRACLRSKSLSLVSFTSRSIGAGAAQQIGGCCTGRVQYPGVASRGAYHVGPGVRTRRRPVPSLAMHRCCDPYKRLRKHPDLFDAEAGLREEWLSPTLVQALKKAQAGADRPFDSILKVSITAATSCRRVLLAPVVSKRPLSRAWIEPIMRSFNSTGGSPAHILVRAF